MTLQEVIAWLRTVEDLACSVYFEAAGSDAASGELADFLRAVSEDEAFHYHLMGSAAELIRSQGMTLPSAVLVDSVTRERIEAPLRHLHAQFQRNELTERHVLEALVAAETSEWNEIFLYVINYCIDLSRTFQYIAANIQAHEKRIEKFIAAKDGYADLADKLSSLQEIWQKKLLVVEDEAAVRSLLVQALGRYGNVTAVENGEEALNRIRNSFFDVVVTDVDMPVRGGISLLREAIEEDEVWRSHFIVCTGNATDEVRKSTEENSVPLLEKPISIQKLFKIVEDVLAASSSTLYRADFMEYQKMNSGKKYGQEL